LAELEIYSFKWAAVRRGRNSHEHKMFSVSISLLLKTLNCYRIANKPNGQYIRRRYINVPSRSFRSNKRSGIYEIIQYSYGVLFCKKINVVFRIILEKPSKMMRYFQKTNNNLQWKIFGHYLSIRTFWFANNACNKNPLTI